MLKDPADHPHAIRFSKPLRDRIAKFCSGFYKRNGVKLDFSTSVRTLIEIGLKQTEKKT